MVKIYNNITTAAVALHPPLIPSQFSMYSIPVFNTHHPHDHDDWQRRETFVAVNGPILVLKIQFRPFVL
jgi:hypothetical protein